MSAPASRPAHVEALVKSVDRYNPSNCHLLEDYLETQLANTEYDLLANLALLKLYQFNPTLLNPTSTLSILFLSLAHAPFAPDFSLAWSLLSDSFVIGAALPPLPFNEDEDDEEDDEQRLRSPAPATGELETAVKLQHLSALLAARKFKSFWTSLAQKGIKGEEQVESKLKELLERTGRFESRLRDSIAVEVMSTFKALSQITLESFLGLEKSSPEFTALAQKHGWTIDGSSVKFPENESNTPKSNIEREHIEIGQLSRLLARSQVA